MHFIFFRYTAEIGLWQIFSFSESLNVIVCKRYGFFLVF